MLYLAWKIWLRGRDEPLAGSRDVTPAFCVYRNAPVINLLNPKTTFFCGFPRSVAEKNHVPSHALLSRSLTVARRAWWSGFCGILLFRGQSIRFFYGRRAGAVEENNCLLPLEGENLHAVSLRMRGSGTIPPDGEVEERLFSRKNNSGIDNDSIISHTSAPAMESANAHACE